MIVAINRTVGNLAVVLGRCVKNHHYVCVLVIKQDLNYNRLFYLHEGQNTWLTNIKEANFFKCLTWCYTLLSGIIVSVFLSENCFCFNESHTSFIWYSSCSKIPIIWQSFTGSVFMNVFALSQIAVLFIGLVCQIALLVKEKELEKQKSNP